MGLAASNVQNYADKNLNKEQTETVKSLLKAKTDYYANRSDKAAPEVIKRWEKYGIKHNIVSPYKAQYYKYGYVVSATNEELRNSLKDIFSSVGKDKSMSEALSMYEKIMLPVLKAAGVADKDFSEVLRNHIRSLNSYYSGLSNA